MEDADNVGQLLNLQNATEVAIELSKEYPKSKFLKKSEESEEDLRTFALIVSAHPFCARRFTCHVMHERAR